ncbi:hypothetical protein C8R42DRAFT_715858 [Lentinula raphanica]|nr:hypothetical protein C8R42DRAFT_715858 [Lentinula raphanica]
MVTTRYRTSEAEPVASRTRASIDQKKKNPRQPSSPGLRKRSRTSNLGSKGPRRSRHSTGLPGPSEFSFPLDKASPARTRLERAMSERLLQALANEAVQLEADKASLAQGPSLSQPRPRPLQRYDTPQNQIGNAINNPNLLNAPKLDRVIHQHRQYTLQAVLDTFEKLKSGQLQARDLKWVRKTGSETIGEENVDEDGVVLPADWIKDSSFLHTLTPEEDRWMVEFVGKYPIPSNMLGGTQDQLGEHRVTLLKYVDWFKKSIEGEVAA